MKTKRTQTTLYLVVLLLGLSCVYSVWGSTTTEDVTAIQKAFQAFTRITKAAIPTVVFIKVEQTVSTSASPFHYNNLTVLPLGDSEKLEIGE